MKNTKKFLALVLALVMAFSLMACETTETPDDPGSTVTDPGTNGGGGGGGGVVGPAKNDGTVNMGIWWQLYYDSSHTSVEDYPSYGGDLRAHMRFDNMRAMEERYDIRFYVHNLTWDGVIESINTSILAGSPDMDVYYVQVSDFGLSSALNGMAIDLRTILPADHDLFNEQKYVTFLDIGDGAAYLINYVSAEDLVEHTYPLAFNRQLIEAYNLECPTILWDRGEWTWDKFIEYCIAITADTTGDGNIDQFGFAGYLSETFTELMFSNGTYLAGGPTENLSSPEVGEVLQLIYDLWNTHQVAFPYDYADFNDAGGSAHDSMRRAYREGNIGFFPIACWIASEGDYDVNSDQALNFDTVYVRWPVGPNGNAATNAGKNAAGGGAYMLPAGVPEPELVFQILYDWWNWYDHDITLRDDPETLSWWFTSTAFEVDLQDHNFSVMADAGSTLQFEVWNALSVEGFMLGLESLVAGAMTPAQVQETYRNLFQDGLNTMFR